MYLPPPRPPPPPPPPLKLFDYLTTLLTFFSLSFFLSWTFISSLAYSHLPYSFTKTTTPQEFNQNLLSFSLYKSSFSSPLSFWFRLILYQSLRTLIFIYSLSVLAIVLFLIPK
ncbi:hypothetical protein Peur_041920 [Populus x canadensis]